MKKSIALQSLAMMAMFTDSAVHFGKNESPIKFTKPQNFKPEI